ncbi:hypothetical protein [Microcoleus sp. B9-D4]
MQKSSQKPGFLDGWAIAWGSETGFLHLISVRIPELSQKPGFFNLLFFKG